MKTNSWHRSPYGHSSPLSWVSSFMMVSSAGEPSHMCLTSHSHGLFGLILRMFPACCQAPMKNCEVAIQTNPLLLISPPILPPRVFCLSAESLNADSASSFL